MMMQQPPGRPMPGAQPAMPGSPPAGQPPMPGAGPSPMPPQGGPAGPDAQGMLAKHVDPNNKLQALLLKRVDSLTPQDGEALIGMSPQAAEALKKVLPEIAFLIDMMVLGADPSGGMQGGAPAAPMPPAGGPGAMPPPAGGGSRLGSLMA